jgi:mRNA interferase RelE/StbE
VNYKLVYTRRSERDIKKLEPNIKDRIGKTLLRYAEDPFRFAEKLSDPILGEYRFRIGDYRVVLDIEEHEIIVLRVGHRREIYRRG